jgi:hypothetical protein
MNTEEWAVTSARDLSRETLEQMISQIQAILWLDMRADPERWDPDNEWDSETVEYIAGVLEDQGLRPTSALTAPPLNADPSIWVSQSGPVDI